VFPRSERQDSTGEKKNYLMPIASISRNTSS